METQQARKGRFIPLFLVLAALLLVPATAAKKQKKPKPEDLLSEKYSSWLQDVELLISKEERALFLQIEKDYQRDAFIERFWKVRDDTPRTPRNEFRDSWEARLRIAREEFGNVYDARAEILLLNGFPTNKVEVECRPYLWPAEVWHYDGSEQVGFEFLLLFFQPYGNGNYRVWIPFEGLDELIREPNMSLDIDDFEHKCGEDGRAVLLAINWMQSQGGELGSSVVMARLQKPKETPNKEWITTFSAYSTDLPEDAETIDGRLQIDFPGRHQSRTVMQGAVWVQKEQLGITQLDSLSTYNLLLNGEILREDQLFENFRYKFDLNTAEADGDTIPLIFQRYLRPGEYRLVVKVEDVASGRLFRTEAPLSVPKLEEQPPPEPTDPETARLLAEANAAIRDGENTLKLVPLRGEWQTGLVRIHTMMTGDNILKATFFLEGRPVLTKKNPPYSVEIDLGNVPQSRVLRVEGYDAEGNEIAADEILLNAGKHRFAVRLVEPREGKTYGQSIRAQADVIVPEGELVERVEFFLNETPVATVYQPPYIQPILLPESEQVAYVRAVAYTPDGANTEDTVFVNFPGYTEDVDIDFVELYTAVLDRGKRPVEGLGQGDFTILEDGKPQSILRFEQVQDLPIHVAVMLDVSASMNSKDRISQAQSAALGFLQQTVQPQDRAAIVTFNDHPNLAARFTNEIESLAAGLAGLKAERGTALYDSLVFSFYYFNGIGGQRAILLLSDGEDESSRFEFDDVLDFSRRAGVALYAIGLDLPKNEARRKLTRLAEETGGRAFFLADAAELPGVYETIQKELRSRYLLAYQSSNTSRSKAFRAIDVQVARNGVEAKTLRGYYP